MEVVSTCVRHMPILGAGKTTPYQLDHGFPNGLGAFINSQEADIFIPEARFLKRFIVEAKHNRNIFAVAKAHCHYACHDADQVEELFNTVEVGLNE